MSCFSFMPLKPESINTYHSGIYDILHTNMSKIAPTGNTYEEDKAMWTSCVKPALGQNRRDMILIFKENELVGFFQYYVNSETFMMDEIQFKPEYQGSGLFTELYRYLIKIIPAETQYTEAYASKKNLKSQAILKHLGLEIIGENKNGNSYHFQGEYKRLIERYS